MKKIYPINNTVLFGFVNRRFTDRYNKLYREAVNFDFVRVPQYFRFRGINGMDSEIKL